MWLNQTSQNSTPRTIPATSYQDVNEIDFGFVEGEQTAKLQDGIKDRAKKKKTITAAIIGKLQAVDREDSLMPAKEIKQTKNKTLPIKGPGLQVEVMSQSLQHVAGIKETTAQFDAIGKFSIRTVELSKSKTEPLGFYIRQGDGYNRKDGVFISRISLGSLVDINGLLRVGEEILEVNRVDVDGFILDDVVRLIQIPNRLILTVRSRGRSLPAGMLTCGVSTNLFSVTDGRKTHTKTKNKNQTRATNYKQNQQCDCEVKEEKNSRISEQRFSVTDEKLSGEKVTRKSSSSSAMIEELINALQNKERNNNRRSVGSNETSSTSESISRNATENASSIAQEADGPPLKRHGAAVKKIADRRRESVESNSLTSSNHNSVGFKSNAAEPVAKTRKSSSSQSAFSTNVSRTTEKPHREHDKGSSSAGTRRYEHSIPPTSLAQKPPPGPFRPARRSSTLHPETVVTLVFDDDSEIENVPDKNRPAVEGIPARLTLPTKPETNSSTRARRHSDSPVGSPQGRRRLPSVPIEDPHAHSSNHTPQKTNENGREKALSLLADLNPPEQRTRRMLPTPPPSPNMGQSDRPTGIESVDSRGGESRGGEVSGKIDSKTRNRTGSNELQVPSRRISQQSLSAPGSPKTTHPGMSVSQLFEDKNPSEKGLNATQTQRPPIQSRKSESHYEYFLQQQRHSMFLQSYSSGQPSSYNTTQGEKGKTGTSTRGENSDKCKSNLSDPHAIDNTRLASSLPRTSASTVSSQPPDKLAQSLQLPVQRSKRPSQDLSAGIIIRPSISDRRCASMATLNEKSILPLAAPVKIERDPGFSIYPDDYSSENLSLSRAVSGMVSFRILKACDLQLLDKKLLEKKKKLYWAIEVDFERKAFTNSKRSSTKTIQWDELFEVDIQHGREVSLSCYTSHTDFSKPVARVSFNFAPFVRCGQSHHVEFKTEPQGLVFVEMEFTEMKTLLKRAPSDRKTGVFGFRLNVTSTLEKSNVPLIVRKCVGEIESRGLAGTGLYRISGNARRKKQLRAEFDENSSAVDLSEENCPDINVIAGILKDYLRELPEPLITRQMSDALVRACQDGINDKSFEVKKQLLSSVLRRLPETNRETLVYLLNHFMKVLAHKEQNKMDARNLSICLGPVLLCPPTNISDGKDLLDLKVHMKVVELLLNMWETSGGVS